MILLTEGQTMSRLFDLDWQLLADSCLMIIAIFFLFLIMSYFLFNPARKLLNDRKDKIHGELEDAKDNMEKAQALKAEMRFSAMQGAGHWQMKIRLLRRRKKRQRVFWIEPVWRLSWKSRKCPMK